MVKLEAILTTKKYIFLIIIKKNKDSANNLRKALKVYKINCFVAHEDIIPSLLWEAEIERALNTMDYFVSLHNDDFDKSPWCQQEIGFALARNIDIIPIKYQKDCLPKGFLSKVQAAQALKLEEMVVLITETIKGSKKVGELYSQINPPASKDDEIPF